MQPSFFWIRNNVKLCQTCICTSRVCIYTFGFKMLSPVKIIYDFVFFVVFLFIVSGRNLSHSWNLIGCVSGRYPRHSRNLIGSFFTISDHSHGILNCRSEKYIICTICFKSWSIFKTVSIDTGEHRFKQKLLRCEWVILFKCF